eukprot:g16044.t1
MTFRTLEDTNLYVVCLESLELADVGPLGGSVITTWYTAASDASACSGNDATVATRARRYFAEPESGETTVFLNFVVFLEGAGASEAGAEEAAADGTTGSSLYLQLSTAEGLPVASAGPISVLDDLAQSDNFEPCEVWHLFSTCYPDQAQEYADQVQEPPDQRSMLSTIHEGPESPGSVELDQLGMSGAGGGSGSRTGEDAETKMAAPAADALFGSGLDKARATPPRGSGTDAGTPTLEVVADEQHNAPALVSRGSSDTSLRAAGLQTLTQTRISPTLLATNTNMSAGQEELHEQQPQQLQQTNNPNLMTSADTLMQTILPPGSANKDPLSQTQLTTIMNGDAEVLVLQSHQSAT